MKKFLLGSVLSFFLSFGAFAEENTDSIIGVSSNITSVKCTSSISGIIKNLTTTTTNSEEKTTPNTKLKSLIKEINSGCIQDILIDNSTNKIMYLFYGDIVKKGVSFLASVYNIDSQYSDDFNQKVDNFPFLIKLNILINPLTKILNIFIMIFIILYTIRIIIKGMQNNLEKNQYKSIIKIIFGFSLISPIQALGGYSITQAIVIFGNMFFFSICNKIAVFTIIIFQFINIQEHIVDVESKYSKDANVTSHVVSYYNDKLKLITTQYICDFRTREKLLDMVIEKKTKEGFENSSLAQCLKNTATKFEISEYNDTNTLPELYAAKQCFVNENLMDSTDEYCGNYTKTSEKYKKIRNEISNNFGKNNLNIIAKSIARNILHNSCLVNNSSNNDASILKKIQCAELDSNFNYVFNEDEEKTLKTTSIDRKDYNIESIVKEYISTLFEQSNIDKIKKSYSNGLLASLSDGKNESIQSFSDNASTAIKSGWLGSYVIYHLNNAINLNMDNVNQNLNEAFLTTPVNNKYFNLGEENSLRGGIIASSSLISEVADKAEIIRLINKTFSNDNSDIYSRISSDFNSGTSINSSEEKNSSNYSFSLYSLLNVNKLLNTENQNCFTELSKESVENKTILQNLCSPNNINPLKGIAIESQNINNNISPLLFTSSYLLHLNSNAQYMKLITKILKTIFAITIFFSYMLPLIPTLIFMGMTLNIFINIFYSVIGVNLIAIEYFVPNDRYLDLDEGNETKIYKLIFSTYISSIILVISLITSFIMMHFSISLVNITYSFFLNNLLNKDVDSNIIINLANNLIYTTIYLIIVTVSVVFSSTFMKKMHNLILSALKLDQSNQTEGMFSTVTNFARKAMLLH